VSIEALERGGRPSRRYVREIRKLFDEVKLISGEKPRSLSQDGDVLVVTWPDGVAQRVALAGIYRGADEIRARRRETRRYMREETAKAARRAHLRMDG
jgi:hypothetical protein